jgi:hypothetical protein
MSSGPCTEPSDEVGPLDRHAPDDMRRVRWVIIGLACLYLVVIKWSLAQHGILHADNGRDVAIAWRIVHGHHFPLRGPLSGRVHLGPLYPYLSAIPIALFGSATSFIFFISLLSLASLYFAYKLGALLFNQEVGLLFAALLGGDFMAMIISVQGGNTALIIPSCLMYLYATFSAILRREARFVAWALVTAAIALQIFLAAASLLPLLAIALFLPMDQKKTRSILIGVSIAFALYLPYLIHQVSHNWEDIRALLKFLQTDSVSAVRTIPLTSLPHLFLRYNQNSASMAVGFSQFTPPAWGRVPAVVCLRLIALASLLGLGLAILGIARAGERIRYVLILAWFLLGWSIIPYMRPLLPFYALFPVYPVHLLFASLAIARLGQVAKAPGAWHLVPYGLVGAVCLLSPLLMAHTFSSFARHGRLQIPAWLMTDLHHEPGEATGTFVIPYLGARQEEQMIRRLTSLPEAGATSFYQRLHGVPLWSTIQSRAALFLVYPPPVRSGESSPFHLLGLLQADIPGRPVGQTYSMGPLILIRSLPSLDYVSVRYSVENTPRWYEANYNDAGWSRMNLPGYAVPTPWESPTVPSMTWAQRPIYFRAKLAHHGTLPTFLGVSFPTLGSAEEYGEVEHLFLNGVEVGQPHLRSPDLLLYNITPQLRPGDNTLALAVGGGAHFILDLFTFSLEQ